MSSKITFDRSGIQVQLQHGSLTSELFSRSALLVGSHPTQTVSYALCIPESSQRYVHLCFVRCVLFWLPGLAEIFSRKEWMQPFRFDSMRQVCSVTRYASEVDF